MPEPLLRDPDFRRLWTIGVIGFFIRWLEILVFGVFAYERSQSAFTVAVMLVLRLLPSALFGVALGAVAARVRRRSAIVVTTATLMATSFVLFVLAVTGHLEVWHVGAASFVQGVAWAGDNPMRRGLIGDLVGPARMGKAMALDVGAMHASRLAGPGIGGLLLAYSGMPAVTLLAALLHLVSLVTVWRLGHREIRERASTTGLRATLAVGFLAARESPRLRGALWITVLFNVFAWPVISMVPVIGRDRLGLAPDGVGLLASVDGIGTLLTVTALTLWSRPVVHGRIFVGGLLVFLAAMPLFALSTHPLAAGAALLLLGMGQSAFSVMQSTIVYVAAPPDRRTQAMGMLTMCIGTSPVGFLMTGWLAERMGATAVVVSSALVGALVLAVTWPWWRACWRDDGAGGR
jgi:MFS family permease